MLDDLKVRQRDGGIVTCDRHLWFSSNDLEYYETVLCNGRCLTSSFVYEISCHGLLLNCNFMHVTDISKLTVSINASRRRLRTSFGGRGDQELEMLVDQNSRMSIREWYRGPSLSVPRVSLNDLYEPLNSVVELPDNNMFRTYVSYVFESNSRSLLDNTVQLKMNFYRNGKLPVSLDSLRLHFKPTVTVYHSGAIFLGDLISNYRLCFGSTFVHVKIIRISEHLWIYKLYYINNVSYLHQDEAIFEDYPCGCEFVDDVTDAPLTDTTVTSSTIRMDRDTTKQQRAVDRFGAAGAVKIDLSRTRSLVRLNDTGQSDQCTGSVVNDNR